MDFDRIPVDVLIIAAHPTQHETDAMRVLIELLLQSGFHAWQ